MRSLSSAKGIATGLALAAALVLCALSTPGVTAASPESRTGNDTPVVFILLDELPTASLMTEDGASINASRYPNIASFAGGATWYRNHTTVGDFTAWAVPSIFSGQSGNMNRLPNTAAYPENVFTLLGPGRRLNVMETLTELCPVTLCPNGGQGKLDGSKNAVTFLKSKYRPYKEKAVKKWIAAIPSGPGSLSVAHIKSPHLPLRFTPEGKTYPGGPLAMPTDLEIDSWTVGEAGAAFVQQRHLLQVGYADRLVGKILKKVRSNGDYDRAMIVLTADHGVSYDRPDQRRNATQTNIGATMNPPLIIKYPGQQQAVISETPTQSIDILPTVAETLGTSTSRSDGVSVDRVPPGRKTVVNRYYKLPLEFTVEEMQADRAEVLRQQYARFGSGKLWRLGPESQIIGTRPASPRSLAGGVASFDYPQRLERADASDQTVPSLVSGRLQGIGKNRTLALTWNGKVVATTRTFKAKGAVRFGFMVPPDVMKRGKNRVGVHLLVTGQLRRIPTG